MRTHMSPFGFWVVLLATVVAVSKAAAVSVSDDWRLVDGTYQKELTVRCTADEQPICRTLCGASDACMIEEPYCRNCHGTTSALLRDFFTLVGLKYVNTGEAVEWSELIPFLQAGSFVSISAQDSFNFYRGTNDAEYLAQFQSLCQSVASDVVTLFLIDSVHVPLEVKYVLCTDQEGSSRVFRMGIDSETRRQPLHEVERPAPLPWSLRLRTLN